MAYNYGFPQTYPQMGQTYYPQTYQPMAQQPMMQPQQAQQSYSPVSTQNSIIWISGEQEAQMYPIAPNNAVALWAKDGKTIYLKSADATGKPTMTIYDLVERTQNAPQAAETAPVNYATKEDLSRVVGLVNGFDSLISGIKTDIETMKGDMYGIAGKKKSAKKTEVTDDE